MELQHSARNCSTPHPTPPPKTQTNVVADRKNAPARGNHCPDYILGSVSAARGEFSYLGQRDANKTTKTRWCSNIRFVNGKGRGNAAFQVLKRKNYESSAQRRGLLICGVFLRGDKFLLGFYTLFYMNLTTNTNNYTNSMNCETNIKNNGTNNTNHDAR